MSIASPGVGHLLAQLSGLTRSDSNTYQMKGGWVNGRRYNAVPWAATEDAALPPGTEMETTMPARPAGFVADVLVPLSQSLCTGLLVGTLSTAVLMAFGVKVNPAQLWAGLALFVMTCTWLLLLIDTRRLLWAIERLTGMDIDRDGEVGPEQTLRVQVETDRGQKIASARVLEVSDDQLLAFAVGIARGRGLTEAAWGGDKTAFPKGINQFRKFRSKLMELQFVEQVDLNNVNKGFQWTAEGAALIGRLVAHTHAHTNGSGVQA
jgi:hypothetical protein